MKEVGPNGDLVFSSTEFGSGSVGKTGQIADILRDLLQNVTLTMRSEEIESLLNNYYTSLEVDNLLEQYAKLTDLASRVATEVRTIMNSAEYQNKYASQTDLEDLNEIVSGYESTIETILGNQTSLQSAWNQYKIAVDNNLALQNSTIQQLNQSYAQLSSSLTSMQAILNALNLLDMATASQDIAQLKTDVSNLKTQMGVLASLNTNAKDSLVAAINELVSNQGTLNQLKTTNKSSLVAAVNELFQSASDGKALIAAAITGKGVNAAATDSYQTLHDKIAAINVGYDTSDATATAADIALGKTAYVVGGKKVGLHTCPDPINSITVLTKSSHFTAANSQSTIANGMSGTFICTSMDLECSNGDNKCSGTVTYLVDGTSHPVSDYPEGTEIHFTNSLVLVAGDLKFTDSNDNHCSACNSGNPGIRWSGILVDN